MKIPYNIIKSNLDTYQKARNNYVAIRQFEDGQIEFSALVAIGLAKFGSFFGFLKTLRMSGFEPVSDPSIAIFANLKSVLEQNTTTPRFKTFIKNRTKKKFDEMLNDKEEFDRLLNGSWKSRPRMRSNGRMSLGTRNSERLEGLKNAFIPLINYIIINQIEITDRFLWQDSISDEIKWYTTLLEFDASIRTKEIDITSKLIMAFSNLVEKEKIDFRQLNITYIMSAVNTKIRNAFYVSEGTKLKCIKDVFNNYGFQTLKEGKMYEVRSSYESRGSLMVSVIQEDGTMTYHEFNKFEDVSTKRDDLLSMLLD
jgi:hypothetical protein